jgi:hypothetical protein
VVMGLSVLLVEKKKMETKWSLGSIDHNNITREL